MPKVLQQYVCNTFSTAYANTENRLIDKICIDNSAILDLFDSLAIFVKEMFN